LYKKLRRYFQLGSKKQFVIVVCADRLLFYCLINQIFIMVYSKQFTIGIIALLLVVGGFVASAHPAFAQVASPENDFVTCSDGIDNDGVNGFDLADDSCVAFRPTITIFHNLINDNGGLSTYGNFVFNSTVGGIQSPATSSPSNRLDLTYPYLGAYAITVDPVVGYQISLDAGCVGAVQFNANNTCNVTSDDNTQPIVVPPSPVSVGGSSTFDYWGCVDSKAANFNSLANKDDGSCKYTENGGEVAGTSTVNTAGTSTSPLNEVASTSTLSCTPYMTGYIKPGKKNDPDQVKLLQEFLNKYEGADIDVNGVYGPVTREAVSVFQVKYASDVLQPWLSFGHASIALPTGIVYKTTLWKINSIVCSDNNAEELAKPELP
jgi:hypothetical protein